MIPSGARSTGYAVDAARTFEKVLDVAGESSTWRLASSIFFAGEHVAALDGGVLAQRPPGLMDKLVVGELAGRPSAPTWSAAGLTPSGTRRCDAEPDAETVIAVFSWPRNAPTSVPFLASGDRAIVVLHPAAGSTESARRDQLASAHSGTPSGLQIARIDARVQARRGGDSRRLRLVRAHQAESASSFRISTRAP